MVFWATIDKGKQTTKQTLCLKWADMINPNFNKSINFAEEFSSKIPALTLLTTLGYQFISPSKCHAMRSKAAVNKATDQVVLLPIMRAFLVKQTFMFEGKRHPLSDSAIDKIMHELNPAMNLGLQAANEALYNAMLYGVTVTEFIDGKKTSQTIALIDWNNISNNSFHVTEELVVLNSEGTSSRRPDIVCFVNGLPLAVIEAKRPDSSREWQSTNAQAVSQHIRNQHQKEIPHLFAYSQLLLAVNGNDGLYATCGTPEKFWAKWVEEEISEPEFARLKNQALSPKQIENLFGDRPVSIKEEYKSLIAGGDLVVSDQDRLIISLLQPERLLEMTRMFTLFDKKVGKIVARYQQVFGIKALIERISTFDTSNHKQGSRQGGVIWHTTGSGKSFTMVFFSKALIWLEELAKCRVIIVTDRVDLETQLSQTFASGGVLSDRDKSDAMATSGRRLAQQIGHGNERVIFSIINKFGSAVKYDECYNDSPNIIVMVDEGHRSQNGENNIRMSQALPNAAFIAFTGTPLLKDDKTENKFGSIIHSYTMQQAVKDKTVTPLLYEERIPELNTNDQAIDAWFDRITQKLTNDQKTDLKRKFSQKGQIYQVEGRIELIAHDISDHFQNFKQQHLKGQLACDSKASAIRYKMALDKIGKVSSVIAMSPPDTREGHDTVDGESKNIVQNWWQDNVAKEYGGDEKAYTKAIIDAFSTDAGPDIMIVVDKLLTGFDEPKNTVLYIDKPLKQHNLIQAIARVNRLHEKKRFGYLIDYRGILKELDITIEKYQDLAERTADQTRDGFDIDDLKGLYNAMDTEYKQLPRLHSELWAIFSSVQNKQDGQALRQVLAPKMQEIDGRVIDTKLKERDDFYAALTTFSNAMKIALQSASFFEDKSFDSKRDRYKQDLKAFVNLRKQVREDADETVDYDEYEADIRSLLDKHIAGLEVREAKGVYLVDNLGKDVKPEAMSDDEARNQTDKITGRVTKMIEQDLADDPYAQEYFSKLLKQAIADAKAMFDAPVKQYMMFADFEQAVKDRDVADVPNSFIDDSGKLNRHAQAYFGLFKHLFDAAGDNDSLIDKELDNELDNDKLVAYAFEIDKIVKTAVAEYSINPAEIENTINRRLLPMLFADLGIDKAQQLIEEVLKITRLGLSRDK